MEKATIFDYARLCKSCGDCKNCEKCPLSYINNPAKESCRRLVKTHTYEANEIILKWCEEHPIETRQDRFLKMFPKARISADGVTPLCPLKVDAAFPCPIEEDCGTKDCAKCRRNYWLEEVEE